jgi:cell wall-associated NlpC family hydrolase
LRFPLRMLAIVLIVATALIAGLLAFGSTSIASAQTMAPAAVGLVVRTAPLATHEKATRLLATTQTVAREQVVAARQAQALQVQQVRTRIVEVARKQIGDRYSAGATGPSAFDCSGLTRYVYKVVTGKELPHQSRAQYARVKKISRKDARPGDLVFFFRNGAHHVGVYIGNGRMIDAAGYGKGVRVSPISGSWWSRTYSGMGRVLPA